MSAVYLTVDGVPVSKINPLPVLIMTSPFIPAGAQGSENTSGDLYNGYFQWKLNDTSGATVQDGLTPPIIPGGIVGSVQPSCDVLTAPGKIDKAFHFASTSNWVYVNDIWGYIAFNSQMGFSFWYKTPNGSADHIVCGNTSDSTGSSMFSSTDGWFCKISGYAFLISGFDDAVDNVGGGGSVNLQDGNWHLVGCYWDGSSQVHMWVDNGIDYGTWNVTTKPQLREHFFLGNTAPYNQDFYIDDFRSWGAVLTQSKMQQLYNYQPSISEKCEISIPTGVAINNALTTTVTNFPSTQNVSGVVNVGNTVGINNFPATQPVSGTIAISNLPATQPVSGTISVSNLPVTQPISGTVTVSNLINPMPVTGSLGGGGTMDVNIKQINNIDLTSDSLLVKRKFDDW